MCPGPSWPDSPWPHPALSSIQTQLPPANLASWTTISEKEDEALPCGSSGQESTLQCSGLGPHPGWNSDPPSVRPLSPPLHILGLLCPGACMRQWRSRGPRLRPKEPNKQITKKNRVKVSHPRPHKPHLSQAVSSCKGVWIPRSESCTAVPEDSGETRGEEQPLQGGGTRGRRRAVPCKKGTWATFSFRRRKSLRVCSGARQHLTVNKILKKSHLALAPSKKMLRMTTSPWELHRETHTHTHTNSHTRADALGWRPAVCS